jgi:long-chain fatty acid transport protein
VLTQIRKENYQDANSYRLGFEYRSSPKWAFQWGVLWDESPVPTASVSPLLPDASRVGFTIGTSYSFSPKLQLDVSFMHLNAKDRSTYGKDYDNFNGLYKTRAELLGFTLVYKL